MSGLKVNAIYNTSGTEVYTAKAWVNFNGTGTVAIRASGNVSSITDNGTGDYTVNFTNAFSDTNYSFIGAVEPSVGQANYVIFGGSTSTVFVRTTSSIRIRTCYVTSTAANAALIDADVINTAFFR